MTGSNLIKFFVKDFGLVDFFIIVLEEHQATSVERNKIITDNFDLLSNFGHSIISVKQIIVLVYRTSKLKISNIY